MMTDVPGYIPGQDPSGSEFEGFANKAAALGEPIFAAKNEPQAAPGNGSLPPGQKEADGTKRTPSVTKRPYLKTIGD
jgi:hypothetical protein